MREGCIEYLVREEWLWEGVEERVWLKRMVLWLKEGIR